jgi:hypothetical protein
VRNLTLKFDQSDRLSRGRRAKLAMEAPTDLSIYLLNVIFHSKYVITCKYDMSTAALMLYSAVKEKEKTESQKRSGHSLNTSKLNSVTIAQHCILIQALHRHDLYSSNANIETFNAVNLLNSSAAVGLSFGSLAKQLVKIKLSSSMNTNSATT